MTLNGKRDDFQVDDFVACEKNASMKPEQVQAAVLKWMEFAELAGVPAETARQIAAAHRTGILSG